MAMNIDRKQFFKVLGAGAVASSGIGTLLARERKMLSENAVGILYDATLCIGCKSCEVECKKVNGMPGVFDTKLEKSHNVSGIWDAGNDLDSKTLNKIKMYRNGTGQNKDTETNGYAFVKRACMHCIDPNCASACPVTALTKDPITGIVQYNKDACIGCRYCQIACPFNIPKFEFDKALPEIVKCEMCKHQQDKGDIPGCCDVCPTGASLFGPVEDLMKEARKRIKAKPGSKYRYPVSSLDSGETHTHTVQKYISYIYGEKETGGTQYLILSAVPYEKLGLPKLPEKSAASTSEKIQHTAYKGMIAPVVLLGGLLYAAHRCTKQDSVE